MSLNIDPQHYRNHRFDGFERAMKAIGYFVLVAIVCVISAMYKGCEPPPIVVTPHALPVSEMPDEAHALRTLPSPTRHDPQ